uniref:Nanos-type domain-containing protein n=1 Tax=Sphaeramia orbicularis TaxID=375764 RepID=A0A673A8N8_9TELE
IVLTCSVLPSCLLILLANVSFMSQPTAGDIIATALPQVPNGSSGSATVANLNPILRTHFLCAGCWNWGTETRCPSLNPVDPAVSLKHNRRIVKRCMICCIHSVENQCPVYSILHT